VLPQLKAIRKAPAEGRDPGQGGWQKGPSGLKFKTMRSGNGEAVLLRRRGCSRPADASGVDTHRDSITIVQRAAALLPL
jgi:hypothetical protein